MALAKALGHQRRERRADQLIGRATEQQRGGAVRVPDRSRRVGPDDCVIH
jgi:hypothetical protein